MSTEHAHVFAAGEPEHGSPVDQHSLHLVRNPEHWISFPDRVPSLAPVLKLDDAQISARDRATMHRLGMIVAAVIVGFIALPPPLVAFGFVGLITWLIVYHVLTNAGATTVLSAWSAERGMVLITSRVPGDGRFRRHSLDCMQPAIETLAAAGMKFCPISCSGVSGRLWSAAPGSMLIDVEYESGEHAGMMSLVSIELPAAVAARYPGLAISVYPPGPLGSISRMGKGAKSRSWRSQEFEGKAPHVEVRAAPGQAQVALFELMDVHILEELARRGSIASPLGSSFVVAQGRLVAWREGSSFDCIRVRIPAHADEAKIAEADARLEAWLDLVRTVHRRLLEECQ